MSSLSAFALVPLDARPVCYALPQQLATMAGVPLALPPAAILGHLKRPADLVALNAWITQQPKSTHWLLALDTLVYGGLIASRQGDESQEELLGRWQRWQSVFSGKPCSGFASILRIPAYNDATEEPDYWAMYGEQLHELSVALHRDGFADETLLAGIPIAVWQHFLATRNRNRALLETFLAATQPHTDAQAAVLSELVLCEDDTGPWGLNRLEADQLSETSHRLGLPVRRQTGADEVACTLMTRHLVKHDSPRVFVHFTQPEAANTVLKFDGIPSNQLMAQQLAACGAVVVESMVDADIVLWCHTPPLGQPHGDHCEARPVPLPDWESMVREAMSDVSAFNKPVIIADVAYANGSDPVLLAALQPSSLTPQGHLYGYAGWNTPGNATGTALAMGLLRWWATRHNCFSATAFQHAMLTRVVDDGLYQSQWRHTLPRAGTFDDVVAAELTAHMQSNIETWAAWCGVPGTRVTISFPCQRRFEIAVGLKE